MPACASALCEATLGLQQPRLSPMALACLARCSRTNCRACCLRVRIACADLVEGHVTSHTSKRDPRQAAAWDQAVTFWRFLGSRVQGDEAARDGGGRIDLIGCRCLP